MSEQLETIASAEVAQPSLYARLWKSVRRVFLAIHCL